MNTKRKRSRKKPESVTIPLSLARILSAEKSDLKPDKKSSYNNVMRLARAALRLHLFAKGL